jgi:transketolase
MFMEKTKELENKSIQIRIDTLKTLHKADAGYVGGCMSVVEILVALYYGQINKKPVMDSGTGKTKIDQDYLILSKAHAAPVQYSILADLGFFDKSELDFFEKPNAMLTKKPCMKIPGISASINSYGHGLSIATGIALSLKMERKHKKVFTILGDGELMCGQNWEAANTASQHKLNNLIAFVDNNKVSANAPIDLGFIQDKFESFGWQVIQVTDGHNFDKIFDAISKAFTSNRKPVCIWCHTSIGKGIEFAEKKPNYQWAKLSEGEMSVIIPKLEALYEKDPA